MFGAIFSSKRYLSEAEEYASQSEALRISYNASEKEMDKIRFFRAKIFIKRKDYDRAFDVLQECYKFRRQQGELSPDLIPVLIELTNLIEAASNEEGFDITAKDASLTRFLSHLHNIQVHSQCNEREIISTQLKILSAMSLHTSDEEYWSLMKRIEIQLNSIPIANESIDVGLNYYQLAYVRMHAALPSDWSNVRKREYHYNTLKIINKATIHLKSENHYHDDDVLNNIENLKQLCVNSLSFFEKPDATRICGEPLHPEDEAEMAALDDDELNEDTNKESSTERELRILSEFSSEVNHALVDNEDRLLTVEDFEIFPETGTINPYRLRLAQGGINPTFREKSGQSTGRSLDEMKGALINDPGYRDQIPPVEIGVYKGKVYSFDTRRVIVHQQAREENPNVQVRYKKISGPYLQERVDAIYSPRPWNGIVTALRFGGKNSESEAYINPVFRDQLQGKVNRDFKPYPSARVENRDDSNGFPVEKKKAEKICSFFNERAKKGSTASNEIISEAKKIKNSQGMDMMVNFFTNKKSELLSQEKTSVAEQHKTGNDESISQSSGCNQSKLTGNPSLVLKR